jgi:hypothetical protein
MGLFNKPETLPVAESPLPPAGLRVRKLADTRDGERVTRYNQDTGEKYLMNPANGAAEPWPLLGVTIENEGGPPPLVRAPMSWVTRGVNEGWIRRVAEKIVERPGGNKEKPWRIKHTFVQCDYIIIKAMDGDVRYRVIGQPDKYHNGPEATDAISDPNSEVRWYYDM